MVAFLMQVIDLLSKKSGDAFLEFRRRSGGFDQRLFMLQMSLLSQESKLRLHHPMVRNLPALPGL